MKKTTLVCAAVLIAVGLLAQPSRWKSKRYFTVASYNVENLFDTIDVAGKQDSDFTPNGKYKWTTERYNKKLADVAKVISSICPKSLPDVVGIIEAENIDVLNDLVAQPALAKVGYKAILDEGPDPRGIDCGLLYNPKTFNYISHKSIRVLLKSGKPTRNILYVKGLCGADTLHLFVNHWSSRIGGMLESQPKRESCAATLRHSVDSLFAINKDANVLIMGDFNDEPANDSPYKILGAKEISTQSDLVNIMYQFEVNDWGTYFYQNDFSMLDNLIVSRNLTTRKSGFRLYGDEGFIHTPEWICYTDKSGANVPARTYVGNAYKGGVSDHFPVYMIFSK